MIAPSGADDVAGADYVGQRLRKLRFPMTDNKWTELSYFRLVRDDREPDLRRVRLLWNHG